MIGVLPKPAAPVPQVTVVHDRVTFTGVCPHGVECVWRAVRNDTRTTTTPGCGCP